MPQDVSVDEVYNGQKIVGYSIRTPDGKETIFNLPLKKDGSLPTLYGKRKAFVPETITTSEGKEIQVPGYQVRSRGESWEHLGRTEEWDIKVTDAAGNTKYVSPGVIKQKEVSTTTTLPPTTSTTLPISKPGGVYIDPTIRDDSISIDPSAGELGDGIKKSRPTGETPFWKIELPKE